MTLEELKEWQRRHDVATRRDAKRHRRRRLRDLVNEYKTTKGCFRCGEKDPVVLDLHHHDPATKESQVSVMVAKAAGFESILSEIQKCVVVCANCHRRLHSESRLARHRPHEQRHLFDENPTISVEVVVPAVAIDDPWERERPT